MASASLTGHGVVGSSWNRGRVPVAVVMISLNEAHNMGAVLENMSGWAAEVLLVDSFSADDTVDIALRYGVHVVQRRFRGFGDQWNFALRELPITSAWTMKLDPDERLTPELKRSIEAALLRGDFDAGVMTRRLWFMGRPLPVCQRLVRLWRTGTCRFSDVLVNEHPIVAGREQLLDGELEHHDSPSLTHWYDKQNRYTAAEAITSFEKRPLAAAPKLFGTSIERRMWLKTHFWKLPGRYLLLFLWNYLVIGAWRAGRVGWIWSRLRADVYRMIAYKFVEMRLTGAVPSAVPLQRGTPDARVRQYE